MTLKVFISYASEDSVSANDLYEKLKAEGFSPWMDKRHLLPGENWNWEIEKAFNSANVILLLLSKTSVTKRGNIQREINDALEKLKYKLIDDIYLIPLVIEPCLVPDSISLKVHYVDIQNAEWWNQIMSSLKKAATQQSIELKEGVKFGQFNVFTEKVEEKIPGSPGHDISIDYPKFTSLLQPKTAKELTDFFVGRAAEVLINSRSKSWDQDEYLKVSEDPSSFRSVDGRWDSFATLFANQNLLSLTYEIGIYEAGAAHPNYGFETFNFIISDGVRRVLLRDFFSDELKAVSIISNFCLDQLGQEYFERTGELPDECQLDWFKKGASAEIDNFLAFTLSDKEFTFLFAPYQVSSYALGRWSVTVPFSELEDVFKINGPRSFL
jgi:hypothetical protein